MSVQDERLIDLEVEDVPAPPAAAAPRAPEWRVSGTIWERRVSRQVGGRTVTEWVPAVLVDRQDAPVDGPR